MTLKDRLKSRILKATKSQNRMERDCLKTVVGEIELIECKTGVALPDDKVISILKKFTVDNNLVISKLTDGAHKVNLITENSLYAEFIPQTLSKEEIRSYINSNQARFFPLFSNSKNVGQIVGGLLKEMRGEGIHVDGSDLKEVVEEIRS